MSKGGSYNFAEGYGPYVGGDDLGACVAEVGSYSTRMGYAGEDAPRAVFRSAAAALRRDDDEGKGAGRRKGRIYKTHHGDWWHRPMERGASSSGSSSAPAASDGDWEVASPVDPATGLLYQPPPAEAAVPSSGQGTGGGGGGEEGMDVDANGDGDANSAASSGGQATRPPGECYDLLGRYLRHGFGSSLPTDPSVQPLVLIEKSYAIPPVRQRCLEVLFEELDVPAAFLARDAVMACYAVGRSTGTVVDVGHGGTVVTPVYDGFVEARGILKSPAGGGAVDSHVLGVLDGLLRDQRSSRAPPAGGYDPSEPPYVLPLYQVRARRARGIPGCGPCRRTCDAMHTEARSYVARTAKEMGLAAAVGPSGYASAPSEEGGQGDGGEAPAAGEGAAGGAGGPGSTAADAEAARIRHQYQNAPCAPFDLPDGTVVEVPMLDRFDAAELLFGRDGRSVSWREESAEAARKALDEVVAASAAYDLDADDDDDMDDDDDVVGSLGPSGLRSVKRGGSTGTRHQPYGRIVRRSVPYLSGQIGEYTSATVPSMVCDAAFKCDRDQQAQLLGNVVLAGGGGCLGPNDNSFPDRLRDEVEAIIHTHTPGWRVKVLSPDRRERSYCSWMGASIMASVGMFHDFWITRKEYDEYGPAILNRKCP